MGAASKASGLNVSLAEPFDSNAGAAAAVAIAKTCLLSDVHGAATREVLWRLAATRGPAMAGPRASNVTRALV
jgi:hypothetical protein